MASKCLVICRSEPKMIITEYMDFGDVKSYLMNPERQQAPIMLDLQLWIALQVAHGMNYLVNIKR